MWRYVLTTIICLTISTYGHPVLNATSIVVEVDSTLELECPLEPEGNDTVIWQLNKLVLAIGPVILSRDPRVDVNSNDAKLMIRSMQGTDEGVYHCHLRSSGYRKGYAVRVEGYTCYPLSAIGNGYQIYVPDLEIGQLVPNGTVVYYECEDGFELVGSNGTTCSDLANGWDAVQPFCVNASIYDTSLTPDIYSRHQLQKLDIQVDQLSKQQERLEQKMTYQVSHLQDNVTSVLNASQTVARAVESVVQRLLNRSVARTVIVKGELANELVWSVQNVLTEVARNRSDHYVTSPRFYSRVPGYAMQIRFYPSAGDHIGLYAGLVPGEFDDDLQWPFRGRFELAVVARKLTGVTVSDVVRQYDTKVDKGCKNKTFERPIRNDLQACGFKNMMSYQRLQKMTNSYLDDNGSMTVRFRLFY